jgi:tRNA-Thr(GGU) m(6)t(6)A37 methyltransferase TsaA
VPARIELRADLPVESLDGIEEFSHAEIVYYFDRVAESAIERGARHPRGNPAWPRVGIFAQRAKDRPNPLGITVVEQRGVDETGLAVRGLDAIDGTPILDLKPCFPDFDAAQARVPEWVARLMQGYF